MGQDYDATAKQLIDAYAPAWVDGLRLRLGSGPRLPADYNAAIDGVAIGPTVGSCGTAAYRGETVIVSDIAIDPLWADYRALAPDNQTRDPEAHAEIPVGALPCKQRN